VHCPGQIYFIHAPLQRGNAEVHGWHVACSVANSEMQPHFALSHMSPLLLFCLSAAHSKFRDGRPGMHLLGNINDDLVSQMKTTKCKKDVVVHAGPKNVSALTRGPAKSKNGKRLKVSQDNS